MLSTSKSPGYTPARITNALMLFLDQHRDGTPNNRAMMENMSAKFHVALKEISSRPAGPSRARAVHEALDRLLKRDREAASERPITCSKGCSACCNIGVMISDDEADLLYMVAKEKDIYLDRERLEIQKEWGLNDYPPNYFNGKARCVFLGEDGACKVYEDRPAACRSYFVVSPKEDCEPEEAGYTKKVLTVLIPNAALWESAALSIDASEDQPPPYLPRLLLERMDRDGKAQSCNS